MNEGSFIIKGDFCWSKSLTVLETRPGAFLVCVEGKSAGVFPRVPEQYAGLPLVDYSDKLIVPGLADLHIHAPQFSFRGLGMDKELLDWLETRAFPEEVKYRNIEYARKSYGFLIEHLKRGPNTRIVFFATVHTAATLLLMDMLEESGLVCLAGKVNMDRNSPTNLSEENAAASLAATRDWLDKCSAYKNVRPILTPRFIPSCSDGLMEGLGKLQREFNLPVQSHLSENHKEIEWVKKLHPDISGYGAVYDRFGLFGHSPAEAGAPAVMAHCVHSDEKEIALLSERQVYIAHCPQSNTNLSSGIAPVRHFLQRDLWDCSGPY
ncbi:hypothetical protein AGMMS49928_02640 [Spirochaetia bacterium]|nr:hypothetical protein AGMMS49928_02640 [Spirochaetia bacterium]